MSKLVGIKYTLYGGMGFLGKKTIYEISIDSDSSIMEFEDEFSDPFSYEQYDIESETSEEIINYAKDVNLYKKVRDLVREGNIPMIIDSSSIRVEFTFIREDVFASWSESYSVYPHLIKELDDFYDYMYDLCGIE